MAHGAFMVSDVLHLSTFWIVVQHLEETLGLQLGSHNALHVLKMAQHHLSPCAPRPRWAGPLTRNRMCAFRSPQEPRGRSLQSSLWRGHRVHTEGDCGREVPWAIQLAT